MQEKFCMFRDKYPVFEYNDFHIDLEDNEYIKLTYDFTVPGLCEFHPSNKIRITNLNLVNNPSGETAKRLVFLLGMVELVSYWKPMCSPIVKIKCGSLSESECVWWKKLYFGGLGEFLYTNNIKTDFDTFMKIEVETDNNLGNYSVTVPNFENVVSMGNIVVPVGGGKDSIVTMELIKPISDKAYCFTVNDQPAREESAALAGYADERIIRTYRTLDPNMLKLNAEGFLNGHTPFSAIVAFLSGYCAYLIGAEYIVLSNESSANETNVVGLAVNHQYSKSYEFEKDFSAYLKSLKLPIHYFSLLRAFNELQIAKQFTAHKKYQKTFKSCNAGSKKNIWCCNCAKCLFVYIIISPFLSEEEMVEIFGENLLNRKDLLGIFDGLVGFSEVKPFECVGTHKEINASLKSTAEKYITEEKELPLLLEYYYGKVPHDNTDFVELLHEFNDENDIPNEFMPFVKEMYLYVSQ